MLYLFWGLINVTLFFYFLYLLIIGGKLVKQKLGMLAAVVFTLGLVSFVGSHSGANADSGTDETKHWKFTSEDSIENNRSGINWIDLDSNLISRYTLVYKYGVSKQSQKHVPVDASSHVTGVTSGTRWVPSLIEIEPVDNDRQFKYVVQGTVEWHLLGFTVYNQFKEYSGIAPVRNRF